MKTLFKTLSVLATLSLLAGCNIFLDGYQEEGAPCKTSEDCVDNLNCVVMEDEDGPWKECAPGGALDQECYDWEFCVEGASCVGGFCVEGPGCPGDCGDIASCQRLDSGELACVPDGKGGEGEPCVMLMGEGHCIIPHGGKELVCIHPDDGFPEGLCVPEGVAQADGQDCFEGACAAGLRCEGGTCIAGCDPECTEGEECERLSNGQFMCVMPGEGIEGMPCLWYENAQQGEDVCVDPPGSLFFVCVEFYDAGAQMPMPTCVPEGWGTEGDPCYDYDIWQGLCEMGTVCDEFETCSPPQEGCEAETCELGGGTCEEVGAGTECVPGEEGHMNQECYVGIADAMDHCFGPDIKTIYVSEDNDTVCYCVPMGEGEAGQPCTREMGWCQTNSHCTLPYIDDSFAEEPYCIDDGHDQPDAPCLLAGMSYICDAGYSCNTQDGLGVCQPYGAEGSFCDFGSNPCTAPGLDCLNLSGSRFCVPAGLAERTEPCWHGECAGPAGELWCLPLDGEETICADPNTGIHNQPCFFGRCGAGMSCQGNNCVLNGGGLQEDFCSFEIQCQEGLFCDFTTAQCIGDELGDGNGRPCSPSAQGCSFEETECHEFWGDIPSDPGLTGRCVPTCRNGEGCEWGGCIFDTEFTDLNANGHCGYHEWTNHYGVACSESCIFGGDDYTCAAFSVREDAANTTTYQLCTTECNAACPPGWECCRDSVGAQVCAPAMMCGFQNYCESAETDCAEPFPACDAGVCTRGCIENAQCPPGAICNGEIGNPGHCVPL